MVDDGNLSTDTFIDHADQGIKTLLVIGFKEGLLAIEGDPIQDTAAIRVRFRIDLHQSDEAVDQDGVIGKKKCIFSVNGDEVGRRTDSVLNGANSRFEQFLILGQLLFRIREKKRILSVNGDVVAGHTTSIDRGFWCRCWNRCRSWFWCERNCWYWCFKFT